MNVLIVDDYQDNRYFLSALLKGHGHHVDDAMNGAEALEKLTDEPFDIVITDILMPVMDGFQLCVAVRADDRYRDMLVVFYTATYVEKEDEDLAYKLGADLFLRKPMDPDELMKQINELVGLPHAGADRHKTLMTLGVADLQLYAERITEKLNKKVDQLEREIKGRQEIESALRRSEDRYRDLFENTSDLIYSVAPDGRILYANRAWLRVMGYSEAETANLNIREVAHPDCLEQCMSYFRKVLNGERVDSIESVFLTRGGKQLIVEGNAHGQMIDGVVVATQCIFRDITERKHSQESLTLTLAQLQTSLKGSINIVSKIVEIRDPYTAGHERRVSQLCVAIAREIGMSEEQVEYLALAASVHDVGKIYVPSEILSKPGQLTDLEYKMIKTHAQGSYDILRTIEFPWPIAEIAWQHHERLDGSGYPNGLQAEEILIEARIIAVADTVEAMSSHRPYRPALGEQAALEEISFYRGSRFDEKIVDACTEVFGRGSFVFSKY
jgi:PAS domain S-box-containing protein